MQQHLNWGEVTVGWGCVHCNRRRPCRERPEISKVALEHIGRSHTETVSRGKQPLRADASSHAENRKPILINWFLN